MTSNRRLRGDAADNVIEVLPNVGYHRGDGGNRLGKRIAAACDFIIATPEVTFYAGEGAVGTARANRSGSRACSASGWQKT